VLDYLLSGLPVIRQEGLGPGWKEAAAVSSRFRALSETRYRANHARSRVRRIAPCKLSADGLRRHCRTMLRFERYPAGRGALLVGC
jgi:hypothetical protein